MKFIRRDEALSHPFANGQYDHEHANQDFIIGMETYKEWLEYLSVTEIPFNEYVPPITSVYGFNKPAKCPMRNSVGNCLPVGGFCANEVSDVICCAAWNAYLMGKFDANCANATKEQEV